MNRRFGARRGMRALIASTSGLALLVAGVVSWTPSVSAQTAGLCAGGVRFEAEAMVVASGVAPIGSGGATRTWSSGPSALDFGPIPSNLSGAGTFQVTYAGGGKRTLFETNPITQFAQQTLAATDVLRTEVVPINIRAGAMYSWSFDSSIDSGSLKVDYVDFCPSDGTPVPPPLCEGGVRVYAANMRESSGAIPIIPGGSTRRWSTGPSALDFNLRPNTLFGAGEFRVRYSGGGKRTLFETNPIRQYPQQTFPPSTGFNVVSIPITLRPDAYYSWSFDSTIDTGTLVVDYVEFCPIGVRPTLTLNTPANAREGTTISVTLANGLAQPSTLSLCYISPMFYSFTCEPVLATINTSAQSGVFTFVMPSWVPPSTNLSPLYRVIYFSGSKFAAAGTELLFPGPSPIVVSVARPNYAPGELIFTTVTGSTGCTRPQTWRLLRVTPTGNVATTDIPDPRFGLSVQFVAPSTAGTYVIDFLCTGSLGLVYTGISAPFTVSLTGLCAGGVRVQAEAMAVASGSAPLTSDGTGRVWSTGPSALDFGPVSGVSGAGTFRVRYQGSGKRTLFETNPIKQFAQQTFPDTGLGFATVVTPMTIRSGATYSWSFDSTIDVGQLTVDYVEFCPN